MSWMILANINLWNPTGVGMTTLAILATAFLLGMVHGITPDEHTWPITFSYSVGSYSWKGGMKAGMFFSLAFTVQRSIASELAYLFIKPVMALMGADWFNYSVYIIVGSVMAGSGIYILRRGKIWHLLHTHNMLHSEGGADPRAAPWWMPLVHGFIAGWGTGAFAILVYTALAPHMGSAWVGFMPGMFFGLGTMVMQILVGGLFGQWMAKRKFSENARVMIARLMSGRVLTWGGFGFALVGLMGLIFPVIGDIQVNTGIKVHNLAHLGIGFFLAVIMLFGVAAVAFFKSIHDVTAMGDNVPAPGTDAGHVSCAHHHHHDVTETKPTSEITPPMK